MELTPDALLREWDARRWRPVYYLLGEESAAKASALMRLKELFPGDDFNRRELDIDAGAQAVIAEALTLPVFADRRLVLVRSPKLPAEARAAFAAYLRSPSPTTTLVLLSEDGWPDRKDALCAAASAAGAVCVFKPLNEKDAERRLAEEARRLGKTLSPEAASALVEEAGADWGILSAELEKIALFVGARTGILLEDVMECLGHRRSSDPWTFARLIQERDLKACLAQLAAMFADTKPDEAVFRSLAQIRKAYLTLLKAKRLLDSGLDERSVEARSRAWKDPSFIRRARAADETRLRRDLRRCLEVETDLKSKSWLDPKLELERFVVELCRAPGKAPAAK